MAERTFKVASLSLGGRKNKIYKSGDIITQNQVEAKVDKLVADGFLVETTSKAVPKVQTPAPAQKVEEPKVSGDQVQKDEIPEYNKIKKTGIVKLLIEKGIEHDPKKSKKHLYGLLKG